MDWEVLSRPRLVTLQHSVREEVAPHQCGLLVLVSWSQQPSLEVKIQQSFHLQNLHLEFALAAEVGVDLLAYCSSYLAE